MKFKMRNTDWTKRRRPDDDHPTVVDFKVTGFEKVNNGRCEMFVMYNNGEHYDLTARININELATPNRWTVHGMDALGHSLLVELVE